MLKILFIPDIIGKIGRNALASELPKLKKRYHPDVVILNAENSAHGIGATQKIIDELKNLGIDVFTSGNHIWDKAGSDEMLDNPENRLIRPANYSSKKSGAGVIQLNIGEIKLNVVNLQGRVYFDWQKDESEFLHCPFKTLEKIIQKEKDALYFVDFHAEATSEKNALATYFDGKVQVIVGTHTHVQTADERILENGTAFITDAGCVAYADSIIGSAKQQVWNLFLKIGQTSKKHDLPAYGEVMFNAIYLEIDEQERVAKKIERINKKIIIKEN